MAVKLTDLQYAWVRHAMNAQWQRESYEESLATSVRGALSSGVPLNTLATALGVSRSRVRRLARVEKSE